MPSVADFIKKVQETYASDNATEHSYRPAIEGLIGSLGNGITALNEPKRIACGAPDFIVTRKDIVLGYIEAKDLHIGLREMRDANKDQQERYRGALPNLIYTNCLDWDFYREGALVSSISIAYFDKKKSIQPKPENYETLARLLQEFINQRPQTITSPQVLAKRMAEEAVLIKDVLGKALREDEKFGSELDNQFKAFQKHLIHDITAEDFADVYAETIAYGMFTARLHDKSSIKFTRQRALELLPKSNPFLHNLFKYIASYNLDERIKWIIEDLAEVFAACKIDAIKKNFSTLTGREDPFLHFYETFLAAYNPSKRRARGVWYTPEAVVNFIVRAVDEVLQNEFELTQGLANTSKVPIEIDGKTEEVHRVQILDPATGTGTFLAEVIKRIAPKVQNIAPAMWSDYVEANLIPRLHGFEILMASYAMCHMKLNMILKELGYEPSAKLPRLSVYLTNSLEEGEPSNQTLPFAQWLSDEAKGANEIKRDKPIMCVIGNPPYSGHSSNKGKWISRLIETYKKSSELKRPAQAKWLSDDYVKFIRLSSHLIEKNEEGVLGFITNHGYLDNPTFLDMRHHLMQIFDKIWVLDLHGNVKKKEVTPEGKPDQNVFDIQQGVSIIIAVKKKDGGEGLAKLYHGDLWGTRESKYEKLKSMQINDAVFKPITPKKAPWNFKATDWVLREKYYNLPSIADWFSPNGRPAPGIVTTHDQFAISWSKEEAISKVEKFLLTESEEEARALWRLCSQSQWSYHRAKDSLANNSWRTQVTPIAYRPFDNRYTIYDPAVAVHRRERASHHMLAGENLGLIIGRQGQVVGSMEWNLAFVSSDSIDFNLFYRGGGLLSPLYLYPDENAVQKDALATTERQINFNPDLYKKLQTLATHPTHGIPDEIQTFDYIYGCLHCPEYRQTYAEFLKINFPRIPWPTSPAQFWDIAQKGEKLRRLHLMEEASIGQTPYPLKGEGENIVEKPHYKDGKIFINETNFFDNAPAIAWDFYIGGYQPAQKWLKDRKGRTLSFDDAKHYQRIIKILAETDRIMKTITMKI